MDEVKMAKGYEYHEESETYVPSRPTRRRDSYRDGGLENYGYRQHHSSRQKEEVFSQSTTAAHYAESPIRGLPYDTDQRTLSVVDRRPRSTLAASSREYQEYESSPSKAAARRRAASTDGLNQRSSTLPSSSRSRPPTSTRGPVTVSKVTRSRSMTSKPAGIAVYHPPSYVTHGQSNTNVVYPANGAPPSTRPGTRMSSKSGRSQASGKPGNTTKAGVVVETMSAPNPFCPNTRGVCCLLVLVNLALILVAIGFIIVLQLQDPAFVWNIGIVILVFGFFTFFVALVYCMCICQESHHPRPGHPANGELYWTHHWQKNITLPEIRMGGSRNKDRWEEQDRFPEDEDDRSSTSSYPRLYLESDYGQRTDREADFETEQEGGGGNVKSGRFGASSAAGEHARDKGRH